MLKKLRHLFGTTPSAPAATLPAGTRAYAVGDVHGRADLFAALAEAIDADDRARGAAETTVILLGDLIDRGPDSAGVVRQARAWGERRKVRRLVGNHEEMLLDSLGDVKVLRQFLRHGGRETLLSYPIDPRAYAAAELEQVQALMREAIPSTDLAYLAGGESMIALGDYLFVHAGIRPQVPLEQQQVADLRWIREPFLGWTETLGAVVVHGHSIFDEPRVAHNRISIDTGAFQSGRLTALGLEGGRRWLIETADNDGAIRVSQRSIA